MEVVLVNIDRDDFQYTFDHSMNFLQLLQKTFYFFLRNEFTLL